MKSLLLLCGLFVLVISCVSAQQRSDLRADETDAPAGMVRPWIMGDAPDQSVLSGRSLPEQPKIKPPAIQVSGGETEKPFVRTVAQITAITGLLIATDQTTFESLHQWRQNSATLSRVCPIVTEMGHGTFSLGLFGGMLGVAAVSGDHRMLETGKIGIESFVLSGLTVQLLKHTFGRERPSEATNRGGEFHGPFSYFRQRGEQRGLAAFDAFPSGHTATAFAAATTMADLYADKPWVSVVSYSTASIVAVTRVTEQTHWLSDCFVGALIGIYSTKLIEQLNYGATDAAVLPLVLDHGAGIALQVHLP